MGGREVLSVFYAHFTAIQGNTRIVLGSIETDGEQFYLLDGQGEEVRSSRRMSAVVREARERGWE